MTTIDPHKAIGIATAGAAIVGNAIADHTTGTAWYQRSTVQLSDVPPLSDERLAELAAEVCDGDLVDILSDDELDSLSEDVDDLDWSDPLIADVPALLDNLFYAIHDDETAEDY